MPFLLFSISLSLPLFCYINKWFCPCRYFIDVMLKAQCIEWALALTTLLLDTSVIPQVVECLSGAGEAEGSVIGRVVQGVEEMNGWAAAEW